MYDTPNDLRHLDAGLGDAVRFALGVAVAGAGVLLAAVVWVSTCQGATADTIACGPPQRTLLALAAPAVLLAGSLRAFIRTHQSARKGRPSAAWQGAFWFLLALMLLVLGTSMPALTGIAVIGA
ncbi:hypothetical protein [Mycobacterium sp. IDR2000157661]|uniref:hypothetical protein n=1 Tax=Mycobacterium sp. IDR2000157661 TaxID=2867005 RepID=UPI001EECCC7D|nr:hypothetical protein [Mycobacterium sp. IDR2000157661]ULE33659.1 hypothetical protein K3G64_02825 [Mycobacterium sp. IDR2000157661]